MRWVILTGEYPAQPGGVSDYTHLVARGLAAMGDDVQVWAPLATADPPDALTRDTGGICLRRLPDHFGGGGLALLDRELNRLPRPCRLLVQYVPQAYGHRAMNLPFCLWLLARGRQDEVWTLFHEVAYPISLRQSLRHNVLGTVNRAMAMLVARASQRVFVTIPAWRELLRPLVQKGRAMEWLPVPATLPTKVGSEGVAAVRSSIVPSGWSLIGHFGTFGSHVSKILEEVLPRLLCVHRRIGLLIGRGAADFAEKVVRKCPELAGYLHATGEMAPLAVSEHLAACDLVVQPYPDGVSCRRTTTMLPLALGTPVVTCAGHLTESIWRESGAVALATSPSPSSIVQEAERMLHDRAARSRLTVAGRELYRQSFALERTIDVLRGTASPIEISP